MAPPLDTWHELSCGCSFPNEWTLHPCSAAHRDLALELLRSFQTLTTTKEGE